jgi:hypothetical protein
LFEQLAIYQHALIWNAIHAAVVNRCSNVEIVALCFVERASFSAVSGIGARLPYLPTGVHSETIKIFGKKFGANETVRTNDRALGGE